MKKMIVARISCQHFDGVQSHMLYIHTIVIINIFTISLELQYYHYSSDSLISSSRISLGAVSVTAIILNSSDKNFKIF